MSNKSNGSVKLLAIMLAMLFLLVITTSCFAELTDVAQAPESTPYPLDAYAEKQVLMAQYRADLYAAGCREENLVFCARLIYAIKAGYRGFRGSGFDWPEKTVLGNYLTEAQVLEFGKTGKGLDVIYFKDKDGNDTDVPALLYVGASDYNVGMDKIKKAIALWNNDELDILNALYNNDICVFFQNKANKEVGGVFKFGFGIIYFNSGKKEKEASAHNVSATLIAEALCVESFANRLRMLEGEELELVADSPCLKLELAIDCAEYLSKKAGKKFYKDALKFFKSTLVHYESYYGWEGDREKLLKIIKENNLVSPFGAETWQEIDSLES